MNPIIPKLETVTRSCVECGAEFTTEAAVLVAPAGSREEGRRSVIGRNRCDACTAAIEADQAAEAERARQSRTDELLQQIPAEFVAASLGDEAAVATWTAKFLTGIRTSLVLIGPVGAGKSYQAWAAWREIALARPETGMRAFRVSDLLQQLRAADPEEHLQLLRRCQRAELLFLEDLGVTAPSEWVFEQLGEIVDERWTQGRPMFVTTNVKPRELGERVGERVVSRLADMAGAPVHIDHADRRRAR